jgi:hypothetical protein
MSCAAYFRVRQCEIEITINVKSIYPGPTPSNSPSNGFTHLKIIKYNLQEQSIMHEDVLCTEIPLPPAPGDKGKQGRIPTFPLPLWWVPLTQEKCAVRPASLILLIL